MLFIDGCFWHGCPIHSHIPKSNETYWRPKLNRNLERDRLKEARLNQSGWKVIRFWEHDLVNINEAVAKIKAEIERRV